MSYDESLAAAETTIANLRAENRAMRIRLAYDEFKVLREMPDGVHRSAYSSGYKNGYLGRPFQQVYVTPTGGVVLDPFCGSGSTGIAARLEGFRFIGIDREATYLSIAERRIAHAVAQVDLFHGGAA